MPAKADFVEGTREHLLKFPLGEGFSISYKFNFSVVCKEKNGHVRKCLFWDRSKTKVPVIKLQSSGMCVVEKMMVSRKMFVSSMQQLPVDVQVLPILLSCRRGCLVLFAGGQWLPKFS